MPKIAILQMNSGIDPEANFGVVAKAAQDAAGEGAEVLFTPEMALLLDRDRKRGGEWIESGAPAIMASRIAALAEDLGIDMHIGSMPVPADSAKFANRAFYCRASGGEPVTYDKMHMFDVELETGESWRESNAYEAGTRAVSVDETPLGRLGLTICYDMRFPALFQVLGERRCDAIAVPAAFTVPTGKAHWHILLRARAIEASAFIIAPAQVGEHEDGRTTYGHSLIVDPWGEVLLDMGGQGPGLAYCDIDLGRIEEVRAQVPSLANRREIAK
jgi:predicted amidohydrolase